MNFGLIISLISGLSTVLGALLIFKKGNKNNLIAYSLSLASGVMICVSIHDLIPEAIKLIGSEKNITITYIYILIFSLIGILISNLIKDKVEASNDSKLYSLGIISMIALILHNIPEGIVTYITTTNDLKLGIKLAVSIALHNIPEGICISIPIYYSTKSKLTAIKYTTISGFSEFLGALIACLFLAPFINNFILGLIFSFIAGLMLNIALTELLIKSISYNKKLTVLGVLSGVGVVLLSSLIL